MAEVACFCGCSYTFDGDGGACPKCGAYAGAAGADEPGVDEPGSPGR